MLMVLISGSTRSVRKAHSDTALVPQQSPYSAMDIANMVRFPVVDMIMKLTTSKLYAAYSSGRLPILSLMFPAGNRARVFENPLMVNSRAILESLNPSLLAAYMLNSARNMAWAVLKLTRQ